MSHPYRIALQYRPDRAVYEARAPELRRCTAEGATRAEALARLEQAIAAQVAVIEEQGRQAPVPVDVMDAQPADAPMIDAPPAGAPMIDAPVTDDDGDADIGPELRARITPSLHRELVYMARVEGVPVEALVAELLAEAVVLREARALGRRRGQRQGNRPDNRSDLGGRQRNRQRDRQDDSRERRERGPRDYADIMENKSSFLEYVRTLDQGEARQGKRRRRRRRNRGQHSGPGPQDQDGSGDGGGNPGDGGGNPGGGSDDGGGSDA